MKRVDLSGLKPSRRSVLAFSSLPLLASSVKAEPKGPSRQAVDSIAPSEARRKPRVVVVGGGLGGLVAAYELERHGVSAHVLEASDVWGGRMYTVYYDNGLYAEAGTQEIWQSNELLRIINELKVPVESRVQRGYSSLVIDGKIYRI